MIRISVAATGVLVLLAVTALTVGGAIGQAGGWSQEALDDIPPTIRILYEQATAECPPLSPTVLAGIGKVESDHGRSAAAGVRAGLNDAGCCAGPMQFNLVNGSPSTWQQYARPGDSVYDPADAIPAAARKLCHDGLGEPPAHGPDPCPGLRGPEELHRALIAYNAACEYVAAVVGWADRYTSMEVSGASMEVLLANPQVELSAAARADLAAGIVDPRLVAVLAALAERYPIRVSVLKTGHSTYVAGTRVVSQHYYGRAADVSHIGGAPVSRVNPSAYDAVDFLDSLRGSLRPSEVGSPFSSFDPILGWFSDSSHLDHLHVGYSSD